MKIDNAVSDEEKEAFKQEFKAKVKSQAHIKELTVKKMVIEWKKQERVESAEVEGVIDADVERLIESMEIVHIDYVKIRSVLLAVLEFNYISISSLTIEEFSILIASLPTANINALAIHVIKLDQVEKIREIFKRVAYSLQLEKALNLLPVPKRVHEFEFVDAVFGGDDLAVCNGGSEILSITTDLITPQTKAIILNWDDKGSNNFDDRTDRGRARIAKRGRARYIYLDRSYPDLPKVFLVCQTGDGSDLRLLDSLDFTPEIIGVWNVPYMTANFERIKKRYAKYGSKVMIVGMNAGKNQERGSEEYYRYIMELKRLGYCGSIWMEK